MNQTSVQRLCEKEQKMKEVRCYLHENPELSSEGNETSKYTADLYKDKDCLVETNVGPNGIKVTIAGKHPGKTTAIHVDSDALPIKKETELPYASKNEEVIHTCDHDVHTAHVLILGETLIEMKDQLRGNVVIIHQPAEEIPSGGAKGMIGDDVLEGVDHVLGMHVIDMMEAGKVCYREGLVRTGRAYFRPVVKGRGGYGSSPHTSNDAIVVDVRFVMAAQTTVSRCLDPLETGVVTIGSLDGEGQFDVIKDTITIEGDIHALTNDARDNIQSEMTRLVKGSEEMLGMICDFEFKKDYPALYNGPGFTSYVATTLENVKLDDIKAIDICELQPPSEDFAFHVLERPPTFIYSGTVPEDGPMHPHHHPKFNINETSMLVVAEAVGTIVLDCLK